MEVTHTRHKLNIYWAKIITILLLSLSSYKSTAQIDKPVNLLGYDDKFLHYGFTLATNYSSYKLKHSPNFLLQDSITSLRSVGSYSFALGFILNMRLAEYFDLRLLPTVAFYERRIRYRFKDLEDPVDAVFESSFIEFPLLLKYKAHRRGNHRMYMVGGIKPGIEVGGKKDEKKEDQLRTTGSDVALDIGFGVDIYYPLFKFSPELRFSLGLKNLHNKDANIYSAGIEELKTYTVTLYLLFE